MVLLLLSVVAYAYSSLFFESPVPWFKPSIRNSAITLKELKDHVSTTQKTLSSDKLLKVITKFFQKNLIKVSVEKPVFGHFIKSFINFKCL
jgi:hypothetical protein